jgi:hypothetical protein
MKKPFNVQIALAGQDIESTDFAWWFVNDRLIDLYRGRYDYRVCTCNKIFVLESTLLKKDICRKL